MKYEKEVTVEIDMSFSELSEFLLSKGFLVKERYSIYNIYSECLTFFFIL